MSKWILIAVAAVFLSGCAYLRAVTFEKDEHSAIESKQKTTVYFIGPGNSGVVDLKDIPKALNGPISECLGDSKTPSAAGAAVIGFIVNYGISAIVDELAARVDALAAKGQKQYSANTILSKDVFDKTECIVLVRQAAEKPSGDEPQESPFGLALVLRKTPPQFTQEATVLLPTYLRMNNAVAITGSGKPVDVSVAVTAKAAFTKDNIRKVDVFATTTFTVAGVKLRGETTPDIKASGLIPQAPTHASAVEVAVAVTESGSGVPDAKKARAELEALQKALGPIIVEKAKALVD